MFAGYHFSDFFAEKDLFTARRSGTVWASGNPWNPENFFTGGEFAAGFTPENSRRDWPNEETYRDAVNGKLSPDQVLAIAPRVFKNRHGFIDGPGFIRADVTAPYSDGSASPWAPPAPSCALVRNRDASGPRFIPAFLYR